MKYEITNIHDLMHNMKTRVDDNDDEDDDDDGSGEQRIWRWYIPAVLIS